MSNIALLLACLAIGMALRRLGRLPDDAHVTLNGFVIHVSLPALTLVQIHAVTWRPSLLGAVLMPWLLFALGAALFWLLGRMLRLHRGTTGALMVIGGLGNTSFVGVPMIESFYGADQTPIGIIIDQLGSYLVLSTVGIALICMFGRGAITGAQMRRRIVTFPPLLALMVAIILVPVHYPAWVTALLTRLGGTLAPLALVSVGLQLRVGALRGNRVALALGLGYKLMLGPAVIALLYVGLFGLHDMTTRVTLFESAMGPQIGGSIVAMQYGLDAELLPLSVGLGTLISFLTVPAWWALFDSLSA